MRSQGNRITVFGVGGLNWIPFLAALKLFHALWVGLRPSMRKVLLFVRLLDCEKNRKLKSSIRWIPSDLNFGSIIDPNIFQRIYISKKMCICDRNKQKAKREIEIEIILRAAKKWWNFSILVNWVLSSFLEFFFPSINFIWKIEFWISSIECECAGCRHKLEFSSKLLSNCEDKLNEKCLKNLIVWWW